MAQSVLEDFLRTGHIPSVGASSTLEDVRRSLGDPRDEGRTRRALILSYDGLEFHFQGRPLRLVLVHIEPPVVGEHSILGEVAWLLNGGATVASTSQKLNELGIAWRSAKPHVAGGAQVVTSGNVCLYFEEEKLTAMSLTIPSSPTAGGRE